MKPSHTLTLLVILTIVLGAAAAHPQGLYASQPPQRQVPVTSTSGSGPMLPQLATIEPALLKKLAEDAGGDRYRVIIELTQQADLEQLSENLSRSDRRQQVVAQLKAMASQSQALLLSFLQERQAKGQVTRVRQFWVFNGLSATVDADTLLAIASRADVRTIREDRWRRWVEPLTVEETLDPADEGAIQWNIARIRADLAWNLLNLDGSGVTVAIIDTGVDWEHPALQMQYRGYRPDGSSVHEGNWICTTDQTYLYPVDGHGHGTHVAGTAVGGVDATGQAIGVAPGASWIAIKALSDDGYGYDGWIHAAFEWLLAPAGDPALAPDVFNASWGSTFAADEKFRPDLQAVRAAGIVPVFSAGNSGPGAGSIESPGSFPETIAVAALDDLDLVATFSSRGPSPWNEIKPELAAPGTQIRSSLPGATYGFKSGTSMAAPHVAGLVALVLQADPALSVDAVEAVMTSTALPLGEQFPNNDTGWGRIDAYRAAAAALGAGNVVGQVTRLPDQQPLPTAQITAYMALGEPLATAPVDELGRYHLALPEGHYDIEASAFGYTPSAVSDLFVQASTDITLDLQLSAAPAGVLWGQISNAETSSPVSGRILIEGTPAWTTSDPQTGQYSMALPTGTYTVTVSQNGYRRSTVANVEIVADAASRQDFSLTPAPTLLLVDSGSWYYGSLATYFESALDAREYVYDLWEIRNLDTDIPAEIDLAPYDIIIWSAPRDSPGIIDAGDAISGYLTSGGNLFLTGQDVGYWDSGLGGYGTQSYFRDLLKAGVLADNAGRASVTGVPGEPWEGLSLAMNSPSSAGNQYSPDLIDTLDPLDASLIAIYEESGGAALRARGCQSYNAIYLAAGLEGLGDREGRAEVMDRALTWLDSPHPSIAARMTPPRQETVWIKGAHITYTVELQNRGRAADQFGLEFSASAWPVSVFDVTFTEEITQSLALGPCQTQTLLVQVTVPPDAGWDITEALTLTARSQSDPGVTTQAAFATKTPAPVLLVDDHRWYDTSDRYRNALEARQIPYDAFRIPLDTAMESTSPSLDRLLRYPVVIWFTAYDWYKTLTPEQEAALSTYLDGGGRLFLSSQDYLYTSGFTDFARDYLGVVKYSEGLTVTQTLGAVGHPVGNGLAPMDLVYPFRNFSDVLHPSSEALVAFRGQHGQPVALSMEDEQWKTTFYAFAVEALGPDDMADLLESTVDWLSPLGDSTLEVSPPSVAPGSELACTLLIRNTGPMPLTDAALSNPIPHFTSFVQGSLEGPATYEPGAQNITWTGALAPHQVITLTYSLQVDQLLADGTAIENVAYLSDETGLSLERVATSRVNSPYLGASTTFVSAGTPLPGHVLTYTVYLRNVGLRAAQARLTDPIPANTSHLPDSGWASSGRLTSTEQLLVWSGAVGPGRTVTITIPVTINPAIEGFYVHNRASLTDGWGEVTTLEASTLVEARFFLPLILNGILAR